MLKIAFSSISHAQSLEWTLFPSCFLFSLIILREGMGVDFVQTNLIKHTNYKVTLIFKRMDEKG